ncbi:MAG: hypothetical protein D3M94_08505 [Rhodocyclales bacterium GT-UBC]|nr:MAG: hypothetical protein D3M94_08505 [Rhodocyclales bacterium GT-UBC]
MHFQSCPVGLHADWPGLVFELAEAYFSKHDADNALAALDHVIVIELWFRAGEAKLLRARVLASTGRTEKAWAQYEAILDHFPDEEARCRYASRLASLGRVEMAAERVLADAEKRASLNDRQYVRTNRECLEGATKDIMAAQAT